MIDVHNKRLKIIHKMKFLSICLSTPLHGTLRVHQWLASLKNLLIRPCAGLSILIFI